MTTTYTYYLIGILAVLIVVSFMLSPRVKTADAFFKGIAENGAVPSVWTLLLSQVTTWIFARSLLTAAILGYYYGIAGALAYTAYYLSFLTGGFIVDSIRFAHGKRNIQTFMHERFGAVGTHCYNLVVILRLLSEVFSNLLVVGLIFGISGSLEYSAAMMVIALITFSYSVFGGLRASLRTDVFQAVCVILMLSVLFILMLFHADFSWYTITHSSEDITSPGWILLVVALLQVWSYPLHDPVMMDRGFLADRITTRRSFYGAASIAIVCILAFALLGVFAGIVKITDETLITTLTRVFGEPYMLLFHVALVISAISTLDSTFSSASKLIAVDMNLVSPTLRNGRLIMTVFLLGGGVFLFAGSKDLFAAVAVSGTVSLFLAPVIFFNIWGGQHTRLWSLLVSFVMACAGGALYMTESAGYTDFIEPLFGYTHKYAKLLLICVAVLSTGCMAFALGQKKRPHNDALPTT